MALHRPIATVRNIVLMLTIALVVAATAFTYDTSALALFDEGDADAPTALNPTVVGTFVAPVEVISRPGETTTFVVEQPGRVVRLDGSVVADISDRTIPDGERGLLGAAFHPHEPYLYLHYSDLDGDTVVAEYEVQPDGSAIVATERIVLSVEQPHSNHNGGELSFGPDGLLYLGLGDGGLANDPERAALDLSSRLGKILRVDPRPTAGASFTVPSTNPFVDTPGVDPTIWSYGLRNPWKFSFDADTGDLWIADVGQDRWEEINHAEAMNGANAGAGVSFGWSAFEADTRINDDQDPTGHQGPLVTYPRAEGDCSISGGAVYRGNGVAGLDGWYIYGDFCSGTIWGFDTEVDDAERTIVELATVELLAAIAVGGDGELYAVSIAGTVSRLDA